MRHSVLTYFEFMIIPARPGTLFYVKRSPAPNRDPIALADEIVARIVDLGINTRRLRAPFAGQPGWSSIATQIDPDGHGASVVVIAPSSYHPAQVSDAFVREAGRMRYRSESHLVVKPIATG